MGGGAGGAIRAVAKVTGVGVANTGLRCGFPAVPPAEHSVMRNASLPVSKANSSSGGLIADAPPKNSWVVIDDRGDEQMMPRLVFGAPPSLEEAKSATNDLKDALEKVFLQSPNLVSHNDSPRAGKFATVTSISNSQYLEGSDCISFHSEAMPKAAMQAFALLRDSPAVQSVVASIATDGKVWDAVLDNPALKDFLESNKPHKSVKLEDELSNNEIVEEHSDESSDSENTSSLISEFLDKVKMSLTGVVNDVSGFIQRIFDTRSAENANKDSQESDSSSSFTDKMVSSLLALATLVMMLVALKRV